MQRRTTNTVSHSKITKSSHTNSNIRYVNSSHLKPKLSMARSDLRLKNSNIKSIVNANINPNVNSGGRGKTAQFHLHRRQSYLNSQYNRRKNYLLQVTKQNKKIYERINSQKSNYSSRVLNRSCDSINSASRVSNRSKSYAQSKQSSRRVSVRNSSRGKTDSRKVYEQPLIKAQNINMIKQQQVLDFHNVFGLKAKQSQKIKVINKLMPNNENAMCSIQQYPSHSQKGQSRCQQTRKSSGTLKQGQRYLISQTSQCSNSISNLAKNKLKLHQFTPDRLPKPKFSELQKNGTSSSIGLPKVIQNTPQRATRLEKIIQDLGYEYRYRI